MSRSRSITTRGKYWFMIVAGPVGEGIPTPDHLNAMRLTAGPQRSQLAAPCLIQPRGSGLWMRMGR